MKLRDILQNSNVMEWHADPDQDICNVFADSREAGPGGLFIAVPGHQVDGHSFIPQVVQAGCTAAVTQNPVDGIPYILVKDTYRELGRIADVFYGHPSRKMRMIGVTGTNGKTTCTYLIKSLFEQIRKEKVGLIGTNQNMIGDQSYPTRNTTPDGITLQKLLDQMVNEGCDTCVMEVSSHALQENRVAEIGYNIGLFTNLTQDHLDFHKTMENYRSAKAKLFCQSEKAALNADDPAYPFMMQGASTPFLLFGRENAAADLKAENVQLYPDRVEFDASYDQKSCHFNLHIPGKFSVYNAMTAISAGLLSGLSLEEMAAAMSNIHGIKGRVEVVPTPLDATVLIDYAHTPDALQNVLSSFEEVKHHGKIYTLFGCGGDRDKTKRPKMGKIVGEMSDVAIVTSDNPRTEDPMAIIEDILPGMENCSAAVKVIPDRREAIRWGLSQLQAGDILLLAGKGHETYQEINHVKHHLDEREEIAEYFSKEA